MKSSNITKINSFGTAGYLICKIGKILMMIAGIACLVSGLLMCLVPKNAVQIDLTTTNTATIYLNQDLDLSQILDLENGILKIGDNSYQIVLDNSDVELGVTTTFYLSNLKWFLFCGTLSCAAICVVLYYGEKLCKTFKECETPFTEESSMGLMKLAWSLIPLYVLGELTASVASIVLLGAESLSISVDWLSVLLILLVFMLSFIFKHGTTLQNEVDETL